GGRILIEAFENALGRERVEVLCGRAVRRIEVNDRREFAAVELDTGERLTARRCLCTVHPKLMLEMLPPEAFSPAYRRRVSELEETPSAVVLFGRRRPGDFRGNLILVTEPHTVADWAQVPLENRPLFVSVPPEAESRGVSVICPATLADLPGGGRERSPEYRDWKVRTAERLLQRLRGCAGDVLGDFDLLDVATPLTFRDYLSSPQGGLYGVKHRLADMPLLSRTTVKGLYLSGQAVVAPGVLGAMCAGLLTESSIV
ncbi:MAG: FAD-dependent oxidoreductase, partial [Phycisphaerales bacterium]